MKSLRCIFGIHEYQSKSLRKEPLDMKLFHKDPAKFYKDHTRMVCTRCGHIFPTPEVPDGIRNPKTRKSVTPR